MTYLPKLFPAGKFAVLGFLGLMGMSISSTASSQEFCSEPVAPYCVSTDSDFETMLQINRCEDDLKEYEQQLDEYAQCVDDMLRSMRADLDEAKNKLERAKEDF